MNVSCRDNIFVSVILPAYNVEEYLEVCLESILEQTHSNLEIIIVDDGSTDSTGNIADDYGKKNSKINVIHKANGGVSSARNAGLRAARGEFVVFVDPDDWITKDHVEYLLHLQELNDADICLTTRLFTKKGESQEEKIIEENISTEAAATLLLSPDIYVGSYGKLYRRQWLLDNELWQNETIYSGEGLHFTVKAVQYTNRITISNKKIYYYRRNVAKSATTKFNINMYINNEHSLNIIKEERIIKSFSFDTMWLLFRTHLFINGVIALRNNNVKKLYQKEYIYWINTIKKDRYILLNSRIVPL